MATFSENLKQIRNNMRMSQDEFAAFLGTSKQVISRYETGQRSPKVSTVAAYADALGVSIGELTGDPAPAPASLGDVSADERELLTAFRALNATGRDVLLGTARGLYQNPAMREDGGSDAATTA